MSEAPAGESAPGDNLADLESGIERMLEEKKPLWPERWPIRAIPDCNFDCPNCPKQLECLIGKRRELGPIAFDREFLCNPRSAISSLFPYELFEPMLAPQVQFAPNANDWPDELREQFVITTGWDFALSERTGADYTAKFTIAMDSNGKRQVLDIRRWRGMSFDEQLDAILKSYKRYGDNAIILETTLFQRLYKNWVTEKTDLPVIGHDTGAQKANLETGVPSLILALENEKYVIPYAKGPTREMVDVWLSECMAYGWMNDKLQGVGEHDDTVIAWWLSEIGVKRIGHQGWGANNLGISDTVEI